MPADSALAATPDLAVAIVSDHDAGTITDVAAAVRAGLGSAFEQTPSRILLADGGSTDGTVARVRDALGPKAADLVEVPYPRLPADLLGMPYHGLPGRARALRAILTAARDLGVKGCVVLDGGLRTVTPRWITTLAAPVLAEGFDYASPLYQRHPYEGTLTKGLVYPLFRALYGVRLRQPAAGEFGCSARLLTSYLDDDLWDRDDAQVGIDIWLATAAAAGGFKMCEAALGVRTHRARGEATLGLDTTIAQVVGSIFADLEARVDVWQRVRGSVSVPVVGDAPGVSLEHADVQVERLIESFRLGYRELREIWSRIIPPKAIVELRKLANAASDRFRLDDDLWAQIVYDFALGYRLRVLPRDHLLRSLTPLYVGWLASWILQLRDLPAEAADARVERLAVAFEAQKPYLMARWRWPEQFRT